MELTQKLLEIDKLISEVLRCKVNIQISVVSLYASDK